MKIVLSFWAFVLCLVGFCKSMDKHRNQICYRAMTCVHTANEKCGIDGKGRVRRFFDFCDLQEYNCLKGTYYMKTSISKCGKLPPIDDHEDGNNQNNYDRDDRNDYSNDDNVKGLDEPYIEGAINLNEEEGMLEGEITVNNDQGILTQPSDDPVNLAAINEDVEGELEVDDTENNDYPVIAGAIEINDEEGIQGEVELGGSGNIEDNDNNPTVQGEIVIDEEKQIVEGQIQIDDQPGADDGAGIDEVYKNDEKEEEAQSDVPAVEEEFSVNEEEVAPEGDR